MTHQATDTASAALLKLIEKWRSDAHQLRTTQPISAFDEQRADAREEDADELQALLASLPAPAAPTAESVIAECWHILGHAYADQYSSLPEALKHIAVRLRAAENPPDYSAGWAAAMDSIAVRERLAALRLKTVVAPAAPETPPR